MDYSVKANIKKGVYRDVAEIASARLPWEKLRGCTVLITGAGGFIGGYLTLALLERNDSYSNDIRVFALVRNGERAAEKFGALLKRNDLTLVTQDVVKPIACERADYVIHAASQASNIQFETDPVGTISANLFGTSNVLEFARESGVKSALIVSSLKVYGEIFGDKSCINEAENGYIDFTSYKNCYAVGKRASETLAASYNREYGLSVKIARPCYIYGASTLDDDRVWAQFIANVVKNQNILLKSSGAARRSFCYVSDTVTALLWILLLGEDIKPYNISNEKSDTTIRNFAKAACAAFPEKRLKLSFANPEDETEPETVVTPLSVLPEILDSTELKELGWQPRVDLTEGIRRAVEILNEE